MAAKKMVRSVEIFGKSDHWGYTVGLEDVVAISFDDYGVQVFFRAEGEGEADSTPRQLEEKPMQYFNGLEFIVKDELI